MEFQVVLRWGKYHRSADPGFHWKWSFAERTLRTNKVLETETHVDQTLTTSDGVSVGIRIVTAFTVSDARLFILLIDDAEQALADFAAIEAANLVFRNTFNFFSSQEFDDTLLKNARKNSQPYGIAIHRIGLVNRFKYDGLYLTKHDS